MGMEKGYSEARRVYIMFVAKRPWQRLDLDHFGQAPTLGPK